jgi:integral membrane protein
MSRLLRKLVFWEAPLAMVRLLRRVAFWEATLFLALLIAVGFQAAGDGHLAVAILGSVHGTVFTGYLLLVLAVRARMRWTMMTTVGILVAGFVPGGGYVVERWALSGARIEEVVAAE